MNINATKNTKTPQTVHLFKNSSNIFVQMLLQKRNGKRWGNQTDKSCLQFFLLYLAFYSQLFSYTRSFSLQFTSHFKYFVVMVDLKKCSLV